MKIKQKNKTGLTFGDFVTAAYRNCGARRTANFVQVAFDARWVVFKKRPLFLDFLREEKIGMNTARGLIGRIKTGPGIALLTVALGCAGFVNTGYSQIIVTPPRVEVVVPAPPVFVAPPIVVGPDPGFFFSADLMTEGAMRVIMAVADTKVAVWRIVMNTAQEGVEPHPSLNKNKLKID